MDGVMRCGLYGRSFQVTNKSVGVRIEGNMCGEHTAIGRRRGARRDTVKFGKELRNDSVRDTAWAPLGATLGRDRVLHVEEHDAGAGGAWPLKRVPDLDPPLTFRCTHSADQGP